MLARVVFKVVLFISFFSVANGQDDKAGPVEFKQYAEIPGAQAINIVGRVQLFDIARKAALKPGDLGLDLVLKLWRERQQLRLALPRVKDAVVHRVNMILLHPFVVRVAVKPGDSTGGGDRHWDNSSCCHVPLVLL